MKKKTNSHIFDFTVIIIAGILNAAGLYIFILPNHFSPGGVTGIATMIQYLTNNKINSGYMIFAMNVPLLVLAFFFLKKDFAIKTAVSIVLSSVMLLIFPHIPFMNNLQYVTDQLMLPAIAGGVIGGFSAGILFRLGSSTGGSEIIGRFLQRKFPQYNIAWFVFALDTVVVLSTAFAIGSNKALGLQPLDIIILSIIKMFCGSVVCSTILEGFSSALKFEIVTLHPEELSREIILELGRGVTRINARGCYTGQEKTMLICIIRKRQISSFQRILKKYPDTFAYIMNTKEVYGRGFSIPNAEPQKFGTAAKSADNTNPGSGDSRNSIAQNAAADFGISGNET